MINVVCNTDKSSKKHTIALRWDVFVVEQNVPSEEEFDSYDATLPFYEAWDDDEIVGTSRVKLVNNKVAKIERLVVHKNRRGEGIGHMIMDKILEDYKAKGVNEFTLSAQVQAIPFYERKGFKAHGDEYLDAGIPHKDMSVKF